MMKLYAAIFFLLAVLIFAGCMERQQQQAAGKTSVQKEGETVKSTSPVKPDSGTQGEQKNANPHAGLSTQEAKPGSGHKGRVLNTINAGGYTYIEVEEKGKKLWVAVMETKVKTGDTVEFPDSPPVENFYSKTLNRTFDKVILSPSLKVSEK